MQTGHRSWPARIGVFSVARHVEVNNNGVLSSSSHSAGDTGNVTHALRRDCGGRRELSRSNATTADTGAAPSFAAVASAGGGFARCGRCEAPHGIGNRRRDRHVVHGASDGVSEQALRRAVKANLNAALADVLRRDPRENFIASFVSSIVKAVTIVPLVTVATAVSTAFEVFLDGAWRITLPVAAAHVVLLRSYRPLWSRSMMWIGFGACAAILLVKGIELVSEYTSDDGD